MLLDTNILSKPMRPSPFPAVVEWLDAQPADQLFISAVTQAEIEIGLALLPEGRRKSELLQAAKEIFALFDGRNLLFDTAYSSGAGICADCCGKSQSRAACQRGGCADSGYCESKQSALGYKKQQGF